jgi:hypothetical protein
MAEDTLKGGILDLSQVEDATQKVKLPDGKLYDMALPTQLSPLAYQRFVSRFRRAQELQAKPDAGEADVEEMIDLVIDLAEIAVPGAERETLGSLPYPSLERLVTVFFVGSSASQTEEPPTAA